MDDLANALEDAQYYMAISQEGSSLASSSSYKFVDAEALVGVKAALEEKGELSVESCLGSCVGFFLFMRHLEASNEAMIAKFMVDVCRFRRLPSKAKMENIWNTYLDKQDARTRRSTRRTSILPTLGGARRKSTEKGAGVAGISEDSAVAAAAAGPTEVQGMDLPEDDLRRDHELIGITGEALESLYTKHSNMQEATRTMPIPVVDLASVCEATDGHDGTTFDKIDALCFQFCKVTQWEAFKAKPEFDHFVQFRHLESEIVVHDDFKQFRVLGRGGFGLVSGCRKATTGKMYAMKLMNKKRVKLGKSEWLCFNERDALAVCDSPFTVCLKYAYHTEEDLVLIMDLMMGGDLKYWLGRDDHHRFPVDQARYYTARTILGLMHLHSKGIVYRDLKPENILMAEDGRTRLSDLGLAVKYGDGIKGVAGTRGYMAPEMVTKIDGHRVAYDKSVDWFSLGCVLYQFLTGHIPFLTSKARTWGKEKGDKDWNEAKAIDAAVCEMEPAYDDMSGFEDKKALDLCKKLLEKDPKKRLGCASPVDLMEHPWFADIDWSVLMLDELEPPFNPGKGINVQSQEAIGGFDEPDIAYGPDDDTQWNSAWPFVSKPAFQAEAVEWIKLEAPGTKALADRAIVETPSEGGSSACVIL